MKKEKQPVTKKKQTSTKKQASAAAKAREAKVRGYPPQGPLRETLQALRGRFPSRNSLARALGLCPNSLIQFEKGGLIGPTSAEKIRALAHRAPTAAGGNKVNDEAREAGLKRGVAPAPTSSCAPWTFAGRPVAQRKSRCAGMVSVAHGAEGRPNAVTSSVGRSFLVVYDGDLVTTLPIPAGSVEPLLKLLGGLS